MSLFETYVRNRQEDAADERARTECALTDLMAGEKPLADAVGAVALKRGISRWWDTVMAAIDNEDLDPLEALLRTREAAHRTLVQHPSPRLSCPFAQGFAVADVEAARIFHADTAQVFQADLARRGTPTARGKM